MPQVEQISIFLATPGDVPAERNYVKEVVAELNRTIARAFGMSLRVVRWEEDVHPAYGGDPQAIINAQIGEMSQYQLFVGIMWNRVGTPTPRASSGTLEEFEIATQARVRQGQPEIFFYFRDAGSELKTIEEIEQRRQVLEFRKEFKKNGLSQSYLDPGDFRDKFREQLSNWIARRAERAPHEEGKGRPEATLDGPSMVNVRVTDAGPAVLDPRGMRGRGRWRLPGRRLLAKLRRQFDLSRQGQGIETAALIPLVNEAVTRSNRQWLILGVVSLCTAIPAGGITDFFFLLRKELVLPLVNLEVSAPLFLRLSPLLILGMHLWLMFTEYALLQNLTRFKVSRSEVKDWFFATSLCRYFPADYGFPAGFVVQGLFWTVFFLVPVGVFLYLQICSLRFRDAIISRILISCTVADLLALGIFIVLCWMVKWSNQDVWGGSRWKRSRSLLAPAAYSVFLALFFISYARLLDDPDFCVRSPEKFWNLPVRRYINLSGLTPAKEGAPEEMATVELGGRDLRCADFSGAHLAKADFARATLWGASFADADLQEAVLTETDLREADLHRAVLQEAHLNRADLTGASAFAANLIAADLTRARLRLGDFREAELDYALLDSAKMELARFDEASLDRVSFKGAAALGASFQHARLRGAEGLALQGVGLRRARVFGLNSCGGAPGEPFPGRVDLRGLDLTPVDWEKLGVNLRERVNPPLGSETLQRVMVAPSAQRKGESACFSNINLQEMETNPDRWMDTLKRRRILYADLPPEPFFKEWPPQSSLTEEEFLQDLADFLIERACDELSRKQGELGKLNLRVLLDRRAEEVDEFGMTLRGRLAMASCQPPRSSGS